MFHRQRLLILIPALLLIPLLVGVVPLKLVNKLAHGGACKQFQGTQGSPRNCHAHSLICQNHYDAIVNNSAPSEQGLPSCKEAFGVCPEPVYHSVHSASIPLRC